MASPLSGRRRGRPPYPGVFTPAEQRVLEGLRRHLTYQQIADELGVTYDAVKYHVSNMLSKAGVERREELVRWSSERQGFHARGFGIPLALKFAASAAAAILVGGIALAAIGSFEGDESVDEVIAMSQEVMATRSFSYIVEDCDLCPPPIVTQYAPPDAIKLSGGKGHDDWPYSLIVGGRGYVSSAGKRWLSAEDSLQFTGMLLSDPRRLLPVAKSPQLEREEQLDGRDASVVAAELDLDAYISGLPPEVEHPEESLLRGWLTGTRVRFWIGQTDHRVLQMELIPPDPQTAAGLVRFDYDRPVDIPMEPVAIDANEAREMGQEVEKAGERLLLAIADFHAAHGSYPPSLDPATLAEVIGPGEWPTNPFTGDQVRQSPETPGDFDYVVIGGGEHMQFTIYGWDNAQLHYDTARFGPIDRSATVRP